MDNKYKFLIGGSLATAAVGVIYYLNEKKKQKNDGKFKEVPRSVVYNILKELQREFYTCFTSLAMVAMQIQSQNRNKFQASELKEILMNQPHLTQEIDEIEKKIYSKHNISKVDFEFACTVTYKNDKELLELQADMKASLEKACIGVAPDSKAEIPDFLTPEKTLQILEKIMKSSASRIHQAFQDLKNQGEDINLNNPQVLVTLNNLKLEDIKKDILIEAGLDKFDDPATKILQYATQKYQRENSNSFGDRYKSLELKHQKTVEHLFKNPDVPDDFVEKSFSEEDQYNPSQNFLSNFIPAKTVVSSKPEIQTVEPESKPLSDSVPTNIENPENIQKEDEKKEEEQIFEEKELPEATS